MTRAFSRARPGPSFTTLIGRMHYVKRGLPPGRAARTVTAGHG